MARNKDTRAIDAVMKAWNSKRRPVEVRGWGLTLYFPPLTTAAMIAVDERMGEPGEGENLEARRHRRNVLLVIHQAELEDGSKAFTYGDEQTLIDKVDFITMQQLIGEVYSSSMPATTAEAKKDSRTTQDSGSK